MKQTTFIKISTPLYKILMATIVLSLLTGYSSNAKMPAPPVQNGTCHYADTTIESKVDYLEKIYFSGQNKEGLMNQIDITLHQLEGKTATVAITRQYVFLNGLKSKMDEAKNSCELEEMLAAGIHNLDVVEALNQQIPRPSQQTNVALGPIISSAKEVGNSVGNAAFYAAVLSKGGVKMLGAAGKAGAAIGGAGSMLETVDQAKGIVGEGKKIAAMFGMKAKDKPCPKVQPKEIQIGEHKVPENNVAQH